jgi:hypothetical protein
MLVDAAKLMESGVAQAHSRARELIATSAELLSTEVQELLMALPSNGEWAPGSGPYYEIINTMLDERSLLIEEDEMPEDGDGPWRVRLTEEARVILA